MIWSVFSLWAQMSIDTFVLPNTEINNFGLCHLKSLEAPGFHSSAFPAFTMEKW
jgi:hypothetical protein